MRFGKFQDPVCVQVGSNRYLPRPLAGILIMNTMITMIKMIMILYIKEALLYHNDVQKVISFGRSRLPGSQDSGSRTFFQQKLGNFRQNQEILGKIRKFQANFFLKKQDLGRRKNTFSNYNYHVPMISQNGDSPVKSDDDRDGDGDDEDDAHGDD